MKRDFTARQGQYLAFIYCYTKLNGRPPAEADMQRYFRVSPPTVHQMVLNLEKRGLSRASQLRRVPSVSCCHAKSCQTWSDPRRAPDRGGAVVEAPHDSVDNAMRRAL